MSVSVAEKSQKRQSSGSVAYPGMVEPLKVPRTPLESRQGYHPKKDELVWKSPPTRQLSREKRVEYESDVRERFYDDYIGQRRTGDAKNEVLTGVNKLGFDPAIYRANALQSLTYDPLRPVPAGVDFEAALRVERAKERQREIEKFRRRRLSDSHLLSKPSWEIRAQLEPIHPQKQLTGALPRIPQERPRLSLQKSLDDSLNPDIVPAVEDWLASASKKEQDVATKFFRTISSHGKRPDPAERASMHSTRVRSAVMTPSRKQREEKNAQSYFQHLARETAAVDMSATRKSEPPRRQQLRRSSSERKTTKGSMFTATRQQPSHYTVHPDWASETLDPYKRK